MESNEKKKHDFMLVCEHNELAAACEPTFADAYVSNTINLIASDTLFDITGCKHCVIDFAMAYLAMECSIEDVCSDSFFHLVSIIAEAGDHGSIENSLLATLLHETLEDEPYNENARSWKKQDISCRHSVAASIWRDLTLQYSIGHITDCANEILIDLASYSNVINALMQGSTIKQSK